MERSNAALALETLDDSDFVLDDDGPPTRPVPVFDLAYAAARMDDEPSTSIVSPEDNRRLLATAFRSGAGPDDETIDSVAPPIPSDLPSPLGDIDLSPADLVTTRKMPKWIREQALALQPPESVRTPEVEAPLDEGARTNRIVIGLWTAATLLTGTLAYLAMSAS